MIKDLFGKQEHHINVRRKFMLEDHLFMHIGHLGLLLKILLLRKRACRFPNFVVNTIKSVPSLIIW